MKGGTNFFGELIMYYRTREFWFLKSWVLNPGKQRIDTSITQVINGMLESLPGNAGNKEDIKPENLKVNWPEWCTYWIPKPFLWPSKTKIKSGTLRSNFKHGGLKNVNIKKKKSSILLGKRIAWRFFPWMESNNGETYKKILRITC